MLVEDCLRPAKVAPFGVIRTDEPVLSYETPWPALKEINVECLPWDFKGGKKKNEFSKSDGYSIDRTKHPRADAELRKELPAWVQNVSHIFIE